MDAPPTLTGMPPRPFAAASDANHHFHPWLPPSTPWPWPHVPRPAPAPLAPAPVPASTSAPCHPSPYCSPTCPCPAHHSLLTLKLLVLNSSLTTTFWSNHTSTTNTCGTWQAKQKAVSVVKSALRRVHIQQRWFTVDQGSTEGLWERQCSREQERTFGG